MSVELKPGDAAPAFNLMADSGQMIADQGLRGNKLVVYFYPKDDTPGCTNEAIDFTRLKDEFTAIDTRIIGISADTVQKHQKFKAKHNLDVTLLSDEDKVMVENYGVWVEKKLYGRSYMGIERASFLIDRNGKISRIWRKVKVKGHAEEVLEAARALA